MLRAKVTTEQTNTLCISLKGKLPPARGFWSLTMYDDKYFFVSNPINRYSVSARQKLKANPDGSTDLYIQKEFPRRRQGVQLAPVSR